MQIFHFQYDEYVGEYLAEVPFWKRQMSPSWWLGIGEETIYLTNIHTSVDSIHANA